MAIVQAREHAREVAPFESCGYITQDGAYVRLRNESEDPQERFRVRELPSDATAFLHSHPTGEAYPSEADQVAQIASGIPWLVIPGERPPFVFGAPEPSEPIIGRGFRWGVSDCWSLIRDVYRVFADVRLGDYPREWLFWERGSDSPYDLHREREGFEPVAEGAANVLPYLRPGDLLLFRIRSRVTNHAAVYIGRNSMLHHVTGRLPYDPSRLPAVEPVGRWLPYLVTALRRPLPC